MDVPVSLAMIFAYFASVIATFTQSGEVFFESISMFAFFLLLGRFLEMRARRKAAAASANLLKLVPAMASLDNGDQIPVKTLKIGDRVRVLAGEHVPADGLVVDREVFIDESMLTGESLHVKKTIGETVFAGTVNGEQTFTLEVNCQNQESMIAKIVRLQDEAQSTKPKIAEIADVVARYFVAAILIISAATYFYWQQNQPEDAFWIMLAVLVATCPCALSLATPTAITCGTSRMSNLGILLRKSHAIETLCKINHLIVDKTGTLTEGKVSLNETQTFGNWTEQQVLAIAASIESHANHPIASAFKPYIDTETKVESVDNHIGLGLSGQYQGLECKIGSHKFVAPSDMQSCPQTVYLSIDGKLAAAFTYTDPLRESSADFLEKVSALGIKTTLLTGDSELNAKPVADKLHIDKVVAGVSPQGKLDYLKSLPSKDVTMMIGDGINDAPTLAGAHLSVAMGGGTDVAKSSADMVLLGDKLDKLISARLLALKTRKIIRENLAWSLGYNLLILPLAVAGMVAPYIAVAGMSASSIIVVTNSLRLLNTDGKPVHSNSDRHSSGRSGDSRVSVGS
ncbi:P-type ATPase [Vibrio ishigakensis]|uniref:P-type ATPase n=2 Tax=Vibrio ishigakensis TaxID=1481914 RepID=A0A0B8NSB6_9VIBR|nr:P-type ATPase [Vibrio ishigakensis]